MSRRRQLSEDERALWRGYVDSIMPAPSRGARKAAEKSAGDDDTAPISSVPVSRPEAPPQKAPPPLAPLGRRLKQRVARGREPIDDRIDLHGLTQKEAHAALLRFLGGAQARGAKTVLVVTGKGTSSAGDPRERDAAPRRGVLRRQVPMWLALPEFRPFVVGFEDAHSGHGGAGALYVRLRRGR